MWDRPLWLLGLLALPVLAWVSFRAGRALSERAERFAEAELREKMGLALRPGLRAARLGVLAGAIALVVLALAGPRLGGSPGAQPGRTPSLVVVLDVSKSMGVGDVAPDRLAIAREALDGLLANLTGWRASLVVFAGEAQIDCPLTSDLAAIQALAARLRPGPGELRQGSNLEAAVDKALEPLRDGQGAIVLISDGEQLEGDLQRAAQRAKRAGVTLWALGVGTHPGGNVPDGKDMWGQPAYRLDRQGVPVLSHADLARLDAAARLTGGFMADCLMGGAPERVLAALQRRSGPLASGPAGASLYAVPLAIALAGVLLDALLAAGALVPFGWMVRLERWRVRLRAAASAVLVVVGLTQSAFTWPWLAPREVSEAAEPYRQGHWAGAIAALEQAVAAHPDDVRARYDLGCARYQARDWAGAEREFRAGLARDQRPSATRAWLHYNLGNALFRRGEAGRDRRALWQQAADEYQAALAIAASDPDARYNLDLVRRRLAQLGSPPPTPSPSPSGGSSGSAASEAPPPVSLPQEAEIRAMLDALAHEEVQGQADLAARPQPIPSPPVDLKELWKRSLNPKGGEDRPDW